MLAVKTVRQRYTCTPEILWLLEQFRRMLNDCIRIGLMENVTSLKALSLRAYKRLANYDVPSYYKLCAISRAAGILWHYRKLKRHGKDVCEPYARRPQLITCYGFKIVDGKLAVPFRPRQPIRIPLNRHTTAVLSEPDLSVRSMTLTASTVGVTFSKEIVVMEPTGLMGIDMNLENVTTIDSKGGIRRHDLSKAVDIKAMYREVKSHLRRHDHRIRRRLYEKYGWKQRNRIKQMIHHVSKTMVMDAKRARLGIVMEKLTGIRKLYRKGNRQGPDYRSRMNGWSFRELQRQIEYKAKWDGIPVIYVSPRGTSARCSVCGSKMRPEESRKLSCRPCGLMVDRDVNAARNILARGLRFSPVAPQSEAMQATLKQGAESIAVSQVVPTTT